MDKKTNRLLWVDIFKGILIILMVLGHSKNSALYYIYTFHMAAFFFISGYTTDYDKYTLYEYIKRKFKQLIIPFFYVNTIFWIGLMLLQKTSIYNLFFTQPVSLETIRNLYLNLWSIPLGGATWFLFVLFLGSISSKLLDEIISEKYKGKIKEYAKVFISLGITLLTYKFFYSKDITISYYIDLIPIVMLFICLGKLVSVIHNDINKIYKYIISIVFLIVYFWFVIKEYYHIEWYNRHFPNLFLMIIVSFGGMIIVYCISKLIIKINNKKIINSLDYLGRNTIGVVLYHFFAFKILYVLYYWLKIVPIEQLKENCLIKMTPIFSVINSILAIIISLIIYKLVSKVTEYIKNIDYKKLINNKIIVFLGLFIITFLYNRWVFRADFVFDDWNNLVTLPYTSFSSLMQILPTDVYCSRPVGWIVVKIILLLFGLNYKGHAFAMMFIHFINGILLYCISNNIFKKDKNRNLISLVSSLIFLLYPISTFASFWEAGMFDLFGCTLMLLCILLFQHIRTMEKSVKKNLYIILLILVYYSSLRTKEMFILIPLILLTYEFFESISIKKSFKETIKNIKILNLIKDNIYLIIMCIIMLVYFGISRYLNASSTITSDINDYYYYTFNPIVLLTNLFKYIYVYFSTDSLVYGDVTTVITFSNYHKIVVLVGLISLFLYTITRLIKKDKIPTILIISFIFIILPVLPMKNMHHVLYLYCPSVFISLLLAYISTNIIKMFNNYEIKLVLIVLVILTFVNLGPSVNSFRGWWIETAKTDSNTFDYFVKLKKEYPDKNKIYILNVPVEEGYTSFYNGNGFIVKVAYNDPKINVFINNQEYDLSDEKTIVIDFNNYNFNIIS